MHNGVIHIKVNLQQIASPRPHEIPRPKTLIYKHLSIHKSALSLTIPSESSPRLLHLKENIANFQAKNLKSPSNTENTQKTQEDIKKKVETPKENSKGKIINKITSQEPKKIGTCLKYYENIVSLSSNLNKIPSQLSPHNKKGSLTPRSIGMIKRKQ
ncbi:hypothetical protein SteCoe_21397 [Stentor coeruleus]|uniref:Uncharacterized protein n=1 Tax=Stentor coeruleus TaxID=5963 RepID=A0A1R2BPT7_9CILI|nr:hypothetical protein SteCoe_21397 [Stentor coeruleus]